MKLGRKGGKENEGREERRKEGIKERRRGEAGKEEGKEEGGGGERNKRRGEITPRLCETAELQRALKAAREKRRRLFTNNN